VPLLSEDEIISYIKNLRSSKKNLIVGDDIAYLRTEKNTYAATDSLIENIHYKRAWVKASDIAYKLFARNWSDFLCKGITPQYALLNLNLSLKSATDSFIEPFLKELDRLLCRYSITLIGGDSTRALSDVFTMTILGSKGKFIPRRAKKVFVHDKIFQIGKVGGSEWARKILEKNPSTPQRIARFFLKPQILESLPAHKSIKAALDQSDSLDKTLRILAKENNAQLCVDVDKILLSHAKIKSLEDILGAAEDLAVFGIAAKNASAFHYVGYIKSVGSYGVEYRRHGKVVAYVDGFEHFAK